MSSASMLYGGHSAAAASLAATLQSPALPSIQQQDKGATVAQKLSALSAKFEGFHQELDLSRNQRKQDDQRKILSLQTQLNAVRDSLALESRNRTAGMKALQGWLDDKITQWGREVEAPLVRQIKEMNLKIDALAIRVTALEQHQVRNKDLVPRLIELRSAELLTQIADCKTQVQQEQALRVEREKRVYVKIQDLGHRLREQLLAEKALTDRRLAEVRAEISVETKSRQSAGERMSKAVEEETARIKTQIEAESQERQKTDEDLVQAIQHYGGALQAGIKIVSGQ